VFIPLFVSCPSCVATQRTRHSSTSLCTTTRRETLSQTDIHPLMITGFSSFKIRSVSLQVTAALTDYAGNFRLTFHRCSYSFSFFSCYVHTKCRCSHYYCCILLIYLRIFSTMRTSRTRDHVSKGQTPVFPSSPS